jgi:hypothetical protein
LFGVPLVLGVLEVGHPALLPGDDIFATIAPIARWWTLLHILQIPLFALLGVAVLLLLGDLRGQAATVSRHAIALFILVYPAFDAAVGISSGVTCLTAIAAGSSGVELESGLQALFWGPVTGSMAVVGSLSWVVGTFTAAWALRKARTPMIACLLLALSGVLLGIAHIRPFGPLACLAFLLAVVSIEFFPPRFARAT